MHSLFAPIDDASKVTPSNLESIALGKIPVPGSRLTLFPPETHKRPHAFGIQPEGSKRTYVIVCDTRASLEDWVATLLTLGAAYDPASNTLGEHATALDQAFPVSPFSQREGSLWKQGAIPTFPTFRKEFKPRYFVLDHDTLFYYRDRASADQYYGSLSLVGAKVELLSLAEAAAVHAQLPPGAIVAGVRNVFAVTPEPAPGAAPRRWVLAAQDAASALGWVRALDAGAQGPPSNGAEPPSPDQSPRAAGAGAAASAFSLSGSDGAGAAGGASRPVRPSVAGAAGAAGGGGSSAAMGSVSTVLSGLVAADRARSPTSPAAASASAYGADNDGNAAGGLPARVELTPEELADFVQTLAAAASAPGAGAAGAAAAGALQRSHRDAVTAGWVLRWDEKEAQWRRRWLVVSRSTKTLRYWFSPADLAAQAKPIKAATLLDAVCAAREDLRCEPCSCLTNVEGASVAFTVTPLKPSRGGASRPGRTLVLAAPTPALRAQWLAALHEAAAPMPAKRQPQQPQQEGYGPEAVEGQEPDSLGSPAVNGARNAAPAPASAPATAAAAAAAAPEPAAATADAGARRGRGFSIMAPAPAPAPATAAAENATETSSASAVGESVEVATMASRRALPRRPTVMAEQRSARVEARIAAVAQERLTLDAAARERDRKMGAAEALVEDWIGVCEGDLVEMLRTLHVILPNAPQAFAELEDDAQAGGAVADAEAVRRAYQSALKAAHPDKMATANAGERVIGEVVFQVLRDAYTVYQAELP